MFERSLLGIRDAFDGAFDEIVPIDYLNLADSLELLHSRVIGISERDEIAGKNREFRRQP